VPPRHTRIASKNVAPNMQGGPFPKQKSANCLSRRNWGQRRIERIAVATTS